MRKIWLLLGILTAGSSSYADVKLSQLFSDNMVLQRNAPIPVWGWAAPDEKITIRFHQQVKTVKADKTGNWRLKLDAETAGGPYELSLQGKNKLLLKGVLVGEVWICSGQSNMEFVLKNAMNSEAEIKAADYPEIREINIVKNTSFTPLNDILPASWKVCSRETAGSFSAVAYFFARKLQEQLKVPIGLIHTSWGGTNIETWTSKAALLTDPDFKALADPGPHSFDEIKQHREQYILGLLVKFQGGDVNAGDVADWKNAGYDDRKWTQIKTPGFWESQGLPDFDGVVWYRKEVMLTVEQAEKGATLELARIDDSDDTYVNGVKVGSTAKNYTALRRYPIRPGLLKAGKNNIAVKVTDDGYNGGITGEVASMQLTVAGFSPIPLAGEWKVKADTASIRYAPAGPNAYPSLLYNAMLSPLIPYGIRGVIWYQGESNCDHAYQYQRIFPLMIKDWRQRWQQGDFPFYFVQLSSFNPGGQMKLTGSQWAELREAQLKTLSVPNTGMAVTTDIGNALNVHPTNKQDVGLRLALNALKKTYGINVVPSGPLYQSMEVKGHEVVITFSDTGTGLLVKNNYGYLQGFQIAGNDQQFKWAKAYVKSDKVIVYNEEVPAPVAVRYGWTDDATEANLYNREGLPASPFRTDNWKGLTIDGKYLIAK